MGRKTLDGYAVVRKSLIGRGFDVLGVGLDDTPSACRDAAERHGGGRCDAVSFMRENPDCRAIECRITVTFEDPAPRPSDGLNSPEEV